MIARDGADLHTQLLAAVVDYTRRGWPVFPLHEARTFGPKAGPDRARCTCSNAVCDRQAKHPRTANGLHEATCQPSVIEEWWTRWPTANVGIATGHGFDALDLDGPDALDRLDDAPGATPDPVAGPMVLTGRGLHIYVAPTGAGNRTAMLPSVDWRGRGGYVVAPPSMHHTGVPYQWTALYDEDTPIVTAAPWLAALARNETPRSSTHIRVLTPPGYPGRASNYGARALESEIGRLALAREGTRNHALNGAAFNLGQLVAGGQLDAHDVASQLLTVAGRIGLTEAEAVATIRSGMASGMTRPRTPEARR